MPLITYVPDVRRFDDVFVSQVGTGSMSRYCGSVYQNGSGLPHFVRNIFAKIGSFVKPPVSSAAPHARAAIDAAMPHLKDAADKAIIEEAANATEAISRFRPCQQFPALAFSEPHH